MDEEWRPVVGYEGFYEISSLGNVKSLQRTVIDKNGKPCSLYEKIVSLSDDGKGYFKCLLSREGRQVCVKVHRLVAGSFLGVIQNGYVINHIDGNRKNNTIKNLEIISIRENTTHGKNSKKRHTGAYFHKGSGGWISRISVNGSRINLGYFNTEEDASSAYKEAIKEFKQENKYAR